MEDSASGPHFPKLFLVNTIGSTLGDMEGTQILRHMVALWPWLMSAWDADGLSDVGCLLHRSVDQVLRDRQGKCWDAGQGNDLEE